MRLFSQTMPYIFYASPLMGTPSIVRYDDWSYELGLPPFFDQNSESTSPSPNGEDDNDRGCGFFFILVVAILVVYYLWSNN